VAVEVAVNQPWLARNKPFAGGVVLAAITLLVWSRVLWNPFINYDDWNYVTENPNVQMGLRWKTVSWAFTSFSAANWHPLTWLSHALDCQLFGLHASGHHLTSLLLHVGNVVLLYWLLYAATRLAGRSFCVAALFAIHPLNVESVAWVAERKNLLCTFFFLLAIAAYGWYVRKPVTARYSLVVGLFGLGLASKPMAITLPFVLLLLDVWPLKRIRNLKWLKKRRLEYEADLEAPSFALPTVSFSTAFVEKLPLLILSGASAVVTVLAQRHGGAMQSAGQLPFNLRFENAFRSYALYVWKAFFPAGLAPYYPHPGANLSPLQVTMGVIFVFGVSLWVWMKRGDAPSLLVGWLWYLGTLVPVIGIVQVGGQALADRYTYIPLIGIFVMAVWTGADLMRRFSAGRVFQVASTAAVIAALSFLTWRQLGFWSGSIDLWTHALAVTADNPVAEKRIASALLDAGRLDEAAAHFQVFLKMDPHDPTSLANLAAEAQKQGHLQEAIAAYELALGASDDPKLKAAVYVNLWTIYTQRGDFARAQENFDQAVAMNPQIPRVMIPSFLQSVNTQPDKLNFLQLGQLLEKAGRDQDARAAYERSLSLDPTFTEAKIMLARVGASNR
jgi:protein O-mannosyl-transferase